LGIIPGPKKPWEIDPFLHPFISELLELAVSAAAIQFKN